jgi:hypothetical protein
MHDLEPLQISFPHLLASDPGTSTLVAALSQTLPHVFCTSLVLCTVDMDPNPCRITLTYHIRSEFRDTQSGVDSSTALKEKRS